MSRTEEKEPWNPFFPYKPRPIQVSLIKYIQRFIAKKSHLVLEAANGTGKTIAALAAVLPYARKNKLKTIYMARTHSQMDRVIEELIKISENIPVSGIALRGRGAYCINPLVKKHAKSNRAVQLMCNQLKLAKKCNFFNNMESEKRVSPILRELTNTPATAEYILDVTEAASICPAETARKMLSRVEVIACSYLYLFDPEIRPNFLDKIDCEMENLVVIIDEAHNLPENVNSIASDELSSFSFNRAIREARNNRNYDFITFMEACVDYLFKENQKMKANEERPIDPAIFLENIELSCEIESDDEFFEEMIEVGENIRFKLAKQGKEPRSSLGRIGEFFFNWFQSIGKKDFTHSVEKIKFSDSKDTFVKLNLSSLDPSKAIIPVLKKVNASISMSGTIGDPDAYKLLTGIDKLSSNSNIFPSPYLKTNISALVLKELTTLYNKRSPTMWTKIVEAIAALISETPANVGIFTPSYAILRELLRNGLEQAVDKPIYEAKFNMSSLENDKLVQKFKQRANKGGAVLCSVLGGRSSEGADFPGELMQSVVVVGIPYAPPNCRIDAQIKYLDNKFPGKGRLLAYQIPAINRASQAAGRPVRGLDDRAFILLLDYRFAAPHVKNFLPEWIRSSIELVENSTDIISLKARQFFESNN